MSPIDEQAMRWLVLQSGRELEPVERAEFDAWYAADNRHKGAYLRAMVIDDALDQARVQASLRPSRAQLASESAVAAWQPAPPRRAFLRYGAALACLAAGTAAYTLSRPEPATVFSTAKGEFRKIPLADQSVAKLNSASLVEVNFTRTLRQLRLRQGEAWFEVAKDKSKPFLVEAGVVRVQAVGTAFGVRRYAHGAEVLVSEGTVEVWNHAGAPHKYALNAGERAFVADGAASVTVSRQPGEVARRLAWRDGKLIFANQTLQDAVADFNRYSHKKIVLGNSALAARTLVGQYQIDAPESFAREVSAFLKVPVRITADAITIG